MPPSLSGTPVITPRAAAVQPPVSGAAVGRAQPPSGLAASASLPYHEVTTFQLKSLPLSVPPPRGGEAPSLGLRAVWPGTQMYQPQERPLPLRPRVIWRRNRSVSPARRRR